MQFDMPEKRRLRQQQEKERRRLQAGIDNTVGQPSAAGTAAAHGQAGIVAAGAPPHDATAAAAAVAAAAATAYGEGVREGSLGAGTSGSDQHGRASLQLRPRSASRAFMVDESVEEEGHPSSSAPSDSSASMDTGSDYIPSEASLQGMTAHARVISTEADAQPLASRSLSGQTVALTTATRTQ